MTLDKNINIKLEICRDKSSKNLTIFAHFNANSPNVFIDKNEYIWIPTIEERELIYDAFNYISPNNITNSSKPIEKEPKDKEYNPVKETDLSKEEEQKLETGSEKNEKIEEIPPIKKEAPEVFEVENETIPPKKHHNEQGINHNEMSPKINIKNNEISMVDTNDKEKKDQVNEGLTLEADADAIKEALKKHNTEDEDSSIIDADEQTIIDKVLSQKKKCKWSKNNF